VNKQRISRKFILLTFSIKRKIILVSNAKILDCFGCDISETYNDDNGLEQGSMSYKQIFSTIFKFRLINY